MSIVLNIVVMMLFLTGVVLLQVFLSKRESSWPGLVLPGINVLIAVLFNLNMAVFPNQSTFQVITQAIFVFVVCNIPTAILLAIYYASREKFKKNKEISKMNIQDLD
jgi:hypothetical protein